jgi:hypothetical protein
MYYIYMYMYILLCSNCYVEGIVKEWENSELTDWNPWVILPTWTRVGFFILAKDLY